jgi:hypothetical protein
MPHNISYHIRQYDYHQHYRTSRDRRATVSAVDLRVRHVPEFPACTHGGCRYDDNRDLYENPLPNRSRMERLCSCCWRRGYDATPGRFESTGPECAMRDDIENDAHAELHAPEMDLHRVKEGQYHRHRYRTDASTISNVISMLSPI